MTRSIRPSSTSFNGTSRTSCGYEPDGLTPAEFDTFGPSARTLRAFVGSYHELLHQIADALVPNPDLKPAS